MKKIYFCGSIRGGRRDEALYRDIISRMKNKGFIVLTEHIGSPEVMGLEAEMTDSQIWEQDMEWLREADLVIAECSTPSLGVGYELAVARTLGKPVWCFYRSSPDGRGLSAMIAGDSYYRLRPYNGTEDLFSLLDEALDDPEIKC